MNEIEQSQFIIDYLENRTDPDLRKVATMNRRDFKNVSDYIRAFRPRLKPGEENGAAITSRQSSLQKARDTRCSVWVM